MIKKKILIIVLLFLFFFHYTKAQLHLPFPDSSGKWTISCAGIFYPPQPYIPCKLVYQVVGDTLLNSVYYHILENEHGTILGFYRIDTNKVFYKNLNQNFEGFGFVSNDEVLLYDFSLEVGDSIKNYDNGYETHYLHVTSIDTIIINGEHLRRWKLFSKPYDYIQHEWIEGIGSKIGFFTYYNNFEYGQNLACFQLNGQDYVVFLSSGSTCETVGIESVIKKVNLTVIPNPSQGIIACNLLGTYFLPLQFNVYNLTGEKVFSLELFSLNNVIDLSGLVNGYYIINVYNEKYQFTNKLVILR